MENSKTGQISFLYLMIIVGEKKMNKLDDLLSSLTDLRKKHMKPPSNIYYNIFLGFLASKKLFLPYFGNIFVKDKNIGYYKRLKWQSRVNPQNSSMFFRINLIRYISKHY